MTGLTTPTRTAEPRKTPAGSRFDNLFAVRLFRNSTKPI